MIHPWRWPSSTASSTAPSSSKSTASPTVPTAPVPRRRPQPSDTPCVTATTASVRIAKTHRQAPMWSFAAFDLVEGEFVDDEPVEAGVVAEPLGQGAVGQRSGQFGQELGTGGIADAITHDASGTADRLDDSAFADAALADEDEVVLAADEGGRGQFLDLGAVDRL